MAVSVKKVYPIKGRKDFYKYVVMDGGKIARGYSGNKWDREMYFDDKASATRVANARRKVNKLNKEWMSSKTTKTTKK